MQKPCSNHSLIYNMQNFRALFSHGTISFFRDFRLLRSAPILSLSASEKSSSACRSLISGIYRHGFQSSVELPDREEGDPAARAWSLCDPVEEQLASSSVMEEVPLRDEKAPQKGTMAIIERVDDASVEEEKANFFSSGYRLGRLCRRSAKEKLKNAWVCGECGADYGQWWGSCPSCKSVGSLKRFVDAKFVNPLGRLGSKNEPLKVVVPQSLANVNKGMNLSDWRIPLHGHLGMEIARVLGGGVVPGSLVLIGGDPGVGKSTLLLQIAANITQGCGSKGAARVMYVSGEESIEQVANRADRMRITTEDLYLYSSTDIEDILDKVEGLSPQALIVDSIQTVYLRNVTGSAGNVSQIKECTLRLMQFAKETNIPVFLIGHVTKTGDIAGPRMLEHMVDVVLYMEGERYSLYRLLRSVKNRFGSTDVLGLLEMTEFGLQAVSNPSEMFLSENYFDSDILAGLALAIVVEGSRTFVIEIQALCVQGLSVARHVNGIQESRADMIIAVLMKQAGLKLHENTIFLNVVSGFKLTETDGDLAIAAAICSSFLEVPIPHDVAFIGEVGLGGELRMVPRVDKRLSAAAKLGFKRCVVPKPAEKLVSSIDPEITVLCCGNLKEVINTVFCTTDESPHQSEICAGGDGTLNVEFL